MKTALTLLLTLSTSVLAADFKEADCAMTRAQVSAAAGQPVKSVEVQQAPHQKVQCVYKFETCSVQITRVSPEVRMSKTEAELAAKLAVDEKRRLLKDFPVPAYSCSGGLYVVLEGETWQVLTMRGAEKNVNPQDVAKALIATRKK